MFSVAISIGIYSYLVLVLGLLGILTKPTIILTTLIFFLGIIVYARQNIKCQISNIKFQIIRKKITAKNLLALTINTAKKNKLIFVSWFLLIILILVNLIGALGPELGFDALWYHLTLPKLYLLHHSVDYIPGGLLYYSEMPRLTEMLYTSALAINSETLAKIIHFTFGILSAIVTYQLARKFFDKKISLLSVLVLYSNLVVDWESITAYIDLARTFFEILALYGFVTWVQTKERKWLIESAVVLGLAICTKTLAFGSFIIFILLILFYGLLIKQKKYEIGKNISIYTFISLLIPLPWFVMSYINTGNPFFPLFTNYEIHQTIWQIINPVRFITSLWNIFTHSPDPLNPLYIILGPLLFFQALFGLSRLSSTNITSVKRKALSVKIKNQIFVMLNLFQHLGWSNKSVRTPGILKQVQDDKLKERFPVFAIVVIYSIVALIVWYVTPQTGGGRFMLPYLPALSILVVSVLQYNYSRYFKYILIALIFLVASISIIYRAEANKKYFPVIFGLETKEKFLSKNLNFSFGDFYDVNGYFAKHIQPPQTVLLYGFHNLYYIDFPFIDSSWVKPGDRFDFIATQNTDPPKRFRFWELVYVNPETHIKLYMFHHHQWIY